MRRGYWNSGRHALEQCERKLTFEKKVVEHLLNLKLNGGVVYQYVLEFTRKGLCPTRQGSILRDPVRGMFKVNRSSGKTCAMKV